MDRALNALLPGTWRVLNAVLVEDKFKQQRLDIIIMKIQVSALLSSHGWPAVAAGTWPLYEP